MMDTKEFIKNRLQELVSEFKHTKVSIQFECLNSAYYVQIQPSSFFKESLELKEFRRAIINEFYDNYFDSTLTFIDKDSLLMLDKFDYSIEGSNYINEVYVSLTNGLFNFNNEIKTTLTFDSLIDYENNYALAA